MATLKDWWRYKDELVEIGVRLPAFDVEAAKAKGAEQPRWIHFGGGNLYRAFHAQVAQDLLEAGALSRGIVVVETYRPFTVDEVWAPYDNDILQVIMSADGTLEERVLASTAAALFANPERPASYEQVKAYFRSPELQMATFTITEKAYGLRGASGELLPAVAAELAGGPEAAASTMGIVCALLHERYRAGAAPIALVSTDNFSRNGERFRESVVRIAEGWLAAGHVDAGFVGYVADEGRVSFPWTMIDRITPNPSTETAEALAAQGLSDLPLIADGPVSYAGFSNTEPANYLVVEDSFPNGRPALEKGGVILCDRKTAERADTMKVTACLNPLHTALAIFGCLLGYTRIWQEMEDPELVSLVKRLGYGENLPVVTDPGVIDPRAFIEELVETRLPNKCLPDAPQRIAADTSQKMPVRFGHTLATYLDAGKGVSSLEMIPLVIAGWLRYLQGIDDEGRVFAPSPDPMLDELMAKVAAGDLRDVLSRREIFVVDLYACGLAEKIERLYAELSADPGAVRATLKNHTH